jgi:hypothetical protein
VSLFHLSRKILSNWHKRYRIIRSKKLIFRANGSEDGFFSVIVFPFCRLVKLNFIKRGSSGSCVLKEPRVDAFVSPTSSYCVLKSDRNDYGKKSSKIVLEDAEKTS